MTEDADVDVDPVEVAVHGARDDVHVRVVGNVAHVAAQQLLRAVQAGGNIALAGGSTPVEAYRLAAAAGADWSGAHVWFSDERLVPLDDPRSNAGAANRALLDQVSARAIEYVRTDLPAAEAAADYDARIRAVVPAGPDGWPRFDLVLLGLGPDGHTASLFPGTDAVDERVACVAHVAVPGLEPVVARVTFTLPLLNAAARVSFWVTGAGKATMVFRAFSGAPSAGVPASLVAPTGGRLDLLLDPAAAKG